MKLSQISLIIVGIVSIAIIGSLGVIDAAPNQEPMTATLVAWVSSQCEVIVEEMEAIVKQNAASSRFSLVNYLRYLNLYDSLKVVASKEYNEFKWVARKARAFAKIYKAAIEVVSDYLTDLDTRMRSLEAAEPKGKQSSVSKGWLEIYETIRYIATHAPKGSKLAADAIEKMQFSPNGSSDKVRSTRYQLRTTAFSR